MSYFYTQKSRQDYLDRKFMISKSHASRDGYLTALNVFDHFAKDVFKLESGDVIIGDLKKLPKLEPAVFDVLQSFVTYLVKDRNARTVRDYLARVVDYFYYNGIKLDSKDLRSNLTVPRIIRDMPYAITKEDMKKILDNAKPKRKALYLALLSSGMRIGEALGLRKRDFDLDQERICITIPAVLTKMKMQRQTFISKEAEEYVRPILKGLSPDDLVFGTNDDLMVARLTEERLFDHCRERAGLYSKYENRNRNKITLHSFRSFCETVASNICGEEYAHALIGHAGYMSMYYRLSPNERLEKYKQIEPYLTIHADIDLIKTSEEMNKRIANIEKQYKEQLQKQESIAAEINHIHFKINETLKQETDPSNPKFPDGGPFDTRFINLELRELDEKSMVIFDSEFEESINVVLRKDKVYCTLDKSTDCKHVLFALGNSDFYQLVKKNKINYSFPTTSSIT